jgi:Uncharacterised protein family (UPF0175)
MKPMPPLARPKSCPQNAAVTTISLHVPDSLLRQMGGSVEALTRQAHLLLALKYFELGQLNFGKAAEMCGLPRADFLNEAKRLGVSVGEYDAS